MPDQIHIPLTGGGAVHVQPLPLGCGLTVRSDEHGHETHATAFLTSAEVLRVIAAMAGGRA
jgi:hypothetical protein